MPTDSRSERVVMPIVEETADIEIQEQATGTVRVRTRLHERGEDVDVPVGSTEVIVERVPVGQWIDGPVAERREGDTTIIPVVEEVAVVEKRLRLVEEVRITRRRTVRHHREHVTLRRTEAEVDRSGSTD